MKVLEDFTIKEYDSPEESTMVTSEGEKMTNSAAICLCLAEMYGQCLPDSKHDANYFRCKFPFSRYRFEIQNQDARL